MANPLPVAGIYSGRGASLSAQEIRDYAQQQGITSNPYALASNQQKFGVSNEQMDEAFGWSPGTAYGWWDKQVQNTPSLNGSAQTSNPQATQPAANPYDQGQGANPYMTQQSGQPMAQIQPVGQAQPAQPMAPQPMAGGAPQQPQQQPQQPQQQMPVGQQQAGINPYLGTMATNIAQQSTDNLQRNILPQIRGGAIANGGLGGSRQGVVEANAINDTQRNLINSLTGMYGQAFESQQGRDLQRYGMDQGFDLNRSGQELQRYGMDQNFYTAQRGQDMQGQQLGANLFDQAMTGLGRQGQGMYQTGMAEQQAGNSQYEAFANLLSRFTGLNGSQTQSSDTSGNALGGALAGGLTAAQIWKLIGNGG